MSTPIPNITSLPKELKIEIANRLPLNDLHHLSLTCRDFRSTLAPGKLLFFSNKLPPLNPNRVSDEKLKQISAFAEIQDKIKTIEERKSKAKKLQISLEFHLKQGQKEKKSSLVEQIKERLTRLSRELLEINDEEKSLEKEKGLTLNEQKKQLLADVKKLFHIDIFDNKSIFYRYLQRMMLKTQKNAAKLLCCRCPNRLTYKNTLELAMNAQKFQGFQLLNDEYHEKISSEIGSIGSRINLFDLIKKEFEDRDASLGVAIDPETYEIQTSQKQYEFSQSQFYAIQFLALRNYFKILLAKGYFDSLDKKMLESELVEIENSLIATTTATIASFKSEDILNALIKIQTFIKDQISHLYSSNPEKINEILIYISNLYKDNLLSSQKKYGYKYSPSILPTLHDKFIKLILDSIPKESLISILNFSFSENDQPFSSSQMLVHHSLTPLIIKKSIFHKILEYSNFQLLKLVLKNVFDNEDEKLQFILDNLFKSYPKNYPYQRYPYPVQSKVNKEVKSFIHKKIQAKLNKEADYSNIDDKILADFLCFYIQINDENNVQDILGKISNATKREKVISNLLIIYKNENIKSSQFFKTFDKINPQLKKFTPCLFQYTNEPNKELLLKLTDFNLLSYSNPLQEETLFILKNMIKKPENAQCFSFLIHFEKEKEIKEVLDNKLIAHDELIEILLKALPEKIIYKKYHLVKLFLTSDALTLDDKMRIIEDETCFPKGIYKFPLNLLKECGVFQVLYDYDQFKFFELLGIDPGEKKASSSSSSVYGASK